MEPSNLNSERQPSQGIESSVGIEQQYGGQNRDFRTMGEQLISTEASGEVRNIAAVEQGKQPPTAAPVSVIPSLPVPAPPVTSSQATTSDDTNSPLIASDDDVIEKEWVDKAKSIIASTKDDPYRREQEVKKLQIDYVQKRYGKKIGQTDS